MLWDKKKTTITVVGGVGSANTLPMKGKIEHLMVIPTTSTNEWTLNLTDKDGDIIHVRTSETGRVDDKEGLAVGKDTSEKLTITLSGVTIDEDIDIIFKVRETV